MMTRHNLEQAMLSPSSVFETPAEVLTASGLTDEERCKILEQWKLDAQRLEDSDNENMSGGERSRLSEVSKALTELKECEKRKRQAA